MLDFQALRLMHHHGGEHYEPMTEHGIDAHDPERELLRGELRGARIFRCVQCAEEVLVLPPAGQPGEAAGQDA